MTDDAQARASVRQRMSVQPHVTVPLGQDYWYPITYQYYHSVLRVHLELYYLRVHLCIIVEPTRCVLRAQLH